VSRPLNPTYAVPQWAPSTNYPAGTDAWAGTATKVAPIETQFTPAANLPAQEMNYVLRDRDNTQQSAKDYQKTILDYLGQMPVKNWPHKGAYAGNQSAKASWSEYHKAWIIPGVLATPGPTAEFAISSDQGNAWTLIGSYAGTPSGHLGRACAARPSDGLIAFVDNGDNGYFDGAAWQSSSPLWDSAVYFREMFYMHGRFIAIGGKSGSSTDFTVQMPDGNTSFGATSNTGVATFTYSAYDAASSGENGLLLAHRYAAAGGYWLWDGTLHLGEAQKVGYNSPASGAVMGVGYDSARGVFVLAENSGSDTRFRTSANGVTWTTGNLLTGKQFDHFKCFGAAWLGAQVGVLDGSTGLYMSYLWVSVDAGATWERVNLGVGYGLAGGDGRVLSTSPEQCMIAVYDTGATIGYTLASLVV
jgi:hypothetical protein